MPEQPNHKAKPHPWREGRSDDMSPAVRTSQTSSYVELSVTTNFTFLTGASHPEELVERAGELGHAAIAITDTNTFGGLVRAHLASKDAGVKLVVGCRLVVQGGDVSALSLLVYPTDR